MNLTILKLFSWNLIHTISIFLVSATDSNEYYFKDFKIFVLEW